jgi:hypothetical protein
MSPWTNITGATASTYTVQSSDSGNQLRVQVTATNSAGSGVADSVETQIVTSSTAPPVNTVLPTVTGPVATGYVLTCNPGVWTGAPAPTFSFFWQRSASAAGPWTNIAGATSQTYTVQIADIGDYIRCVVSASNSAGANAANTAPVGPAIGAAPTNTSLPVISGNPQEGQVLTTSDGTWTGYPTPTFTYLWQVSPDKVTWTTATGGGATTAAYTIAVADVNNYLRCQVQATNASGFANALAAPVGPVRVAGVPGQVTPPSIVPTPTPLPNAPVAVTGVLLAEEFNGPLDPTIWNTSWFNGSVQNGVTTSAANVSVANGTLILTLSVSGSVGASVNTNPNDPTTGAHTGFTYTIGYVEASIMWPAAALVSGDLSSTTAGGSAFWSTGQNWPNTGEIDIVEIGTTPQGFYDNYHSGGPTLDGTNHADNNGPISGSWADGHFHTFGVNRRVGFADIYWDAVLIRTITTYDQQAPHYLVLNICGTAPNGTQIVVDYVRAWSTT